jgi:hypothetical protein
MLQQKYHYNIYNIFLVFDGKVHFSRSRHYDAGIIIWVTSKILFEKGSFLGQALCLQPSSSLTRQHQASASM